MVVLSRTTTLPPPTLVVEVVEWNLMSTARNSARSARNWPCTKMKQVDMRHESQFRVEQGAENLKNSKLENPRPPPFGPSSSS